MNEERRHIVEPSFHEDEIKLAKKMMDKLRTTMEFLYYMMNHRPTTPPFTMLLISTEDIHLETMLPQWKRHTDILVEIDKEKNTYVLICQATDSEGARNFSEILLSNIHIYKESSTYCIATEVSSPVHSIQDILFKMVEKYMIAKQNKDDNKIIFTRAMKGSKLFEDTVTYAQ